MMKAMRLFAAATVRALLIAFLCVPCTALAADRLSDLVDQSLTQSEAIPAWAAGETYQPGTERTSENPGVLDDNGDAAIFIWQMKDTTEHVAGAAWDAAERDHWRPIGVYVAPPSSILGAAQMVNVAFNSTSLNQGYSGSNQPYTSPDYDVTLAAGHVAVVMSLQQNTTSLESGSRVGGLLQILNSAGTVVASETFGIRTVDSNAGWRDHSNLVFLVQTAGVYRIRFRTNAGAGSGNRTVASGNVRVSILSAAP